MQFDPLYYKDRIRTVNPAGDVGIITLWSPVATVERKLGQVAPELLDPERSRVAVVANLYGDGMLAMFCNLLFNPQIRHLVAMGQDMGLATVDELHAFFSQGVEDAVVLGRPIKRVKGTQRLLDLPDGFDVEHLQKHISFTALGQLSQSDFGDRLRQHFAGLPAPVPADGAERREVRLKQPSAEDFAYLPSDPLAHHVERRRPLDCWEEIVCRVMRFGRPITLRKGQRLELQNVRVVIREPAMEPAPHLRHYEFDLKRFEAYQVKIMTAALPDEISYTYGNRLRGHFATTGAPDSGCDTLATAAALLRENPETRHAYVSLWDTSLDLLGADGQGSDDSVPCLTTLFFRQTQGKLGLTATYRSHNLLTAWMENVYGLMAIQAHVAREAGMEPGPITVISHSLTINPAETRFAIAKELVKGRRKDEDYDREHGKFVLREDPNGYFSVTVDEEAERIMAVHLHDNVVIEQYVGRTANEIEEQVARDMAITLPSHAMWFGRQLALMEAKLADAKRRKARSAAGEARAAE